MINDSTLLGMQELKIFPSLALIMGLLSCTWIKKVIDIKTKPFRCEQFWFQILIFINVVKEAWKLKFVGSNSFQLVKKIQVFRKKC